ncbi:type II toxin-antitoxin system RelB/DinJ family antitoxin [Ruminococcus sp.]|uniref:type II toxin-antitoxin system RelB/DinJ family antitoxin n=1 Tax=Ruminococcus sp. TaxID=41978 RepID=UPI002E761DF8|nr:type II toxin-antitoxin system RelB/DinJ family antitoxin [Ruminococcus sp.]MEE1262666.1 type II toxin-antitoxin system RelB/DinJ family antitoxin [Ruminococcus sp.]
MAKVSTNVSIDADIKKQAQELFAELGMDLSTAINIFIRQSLRQRSIPFEITADVPNEETKRAIENVRNGIGLSRGFQSVSELMEDLYADD